MASLTPITKVENFRKIFLDGLERMSIPPCRDPTKFIYAGGLSNTYYGDQNSETCNSTAATHYNYFCEFIKYHTPGEEPELTNECLCEHRISVNCLILHIETKQLIVCGCCCIKQFMGVDESKKCVKCHLTNYKPRNKEKLCISCIKEVALESIEALRKEMQEHAAKSREFLKARERAAKSQELLEARERAHTTQSLELNTAPHRRLPSYLQNVKPKKTNLYGGSLF